MTGDGSHTIAIDEWSASYHSLYGAVRESSHVFITTGLDYVLQGDERKEVNLFEMGFGTGLNAFLTAIEAKKRNIVVCYTSIERDPLTPKESESLNYPELLGHRELYRQLQEAEWNKEVRITELFRLRKVHDRVEDYIDDNKFDLIYFHAFAPAAQLELWTEEVFKKMYDLLKDGGVLVTYCSKGIVRRAMQAAGFQVTKLKGPPQKKHIVRAIKLP